MMKSSKRKCPQCNGELRRIHRRGIDRVISYFRRVHRYQCKSEVCEWEGTINLGRSVRLKEFDNFKGIVYIVLLGLVVGYALVTWLNRVEPPQQVEQSEN